MTSTYFSKGSPLGGAPEFIGLVLSLFWFVAVSVAIHSYNKPCVKLSVKQHQLQLVLRYPWTVIHKSYTAEDILEAWVAEERDVDGEPYFYARIRFRDGREIDLKESAERETCHAILEQFRSAMTTE
jgi:hypothetical protein